MAENYVKTIETLRLLSSSYEDQVRCFPDFADVPDEVISSFETVFLLIPSLIEEERFSFKSIASILRIYNKMQWSLRNLDLDDFSSTEWNELREISKNTLRLLDEVIQKPDMKYI